MCLLAAAAVAVYVPSARTQEALDATSPENAALRLLFVGASYDVRRAFVVPCGSN